jgi:hypothetical protein
MKSLLEALERLGPEGVGVRDALPDATLTSIECAGPLSWLPIQANLDLTRAIHQKFGPERSSEALQQLIRDVYANSAVRSVIQPMMGFFAVGPGNLARWMPRVYQLLFRGCGRWQTPTAYEARRPEITLELVDLPVACAEDPIWIDSVAQSLFALLVLAEREGEVELVEHEPEGRRARFRVLSHEPSR